MKPTGCGGCSFTGCSSGASGASAEGPGRHHSLCPAEMSTVPRRSPRPCTVPTPGPSRDPPLPVSVGVSARTLRIHASHSQRPFVSGFPPAVMLWKPLRAAHGSAHTCLSASHLGPPGSVCSCHLQRPPGSRCHGAVLLPTPRGLFGVIPRPNCGLLILRGLMGQVSRVGWAGQRRCPEAGRVGLPPGPGGWRGLRESSVPFPLPVHTLFRRAGLLR